MVHGTGITRNRYPCLCFRWHRHVCGGKLVGKSAHTTLFFPKICFFPRKHGKPASMLGFSVCLYYTVRAHLRHDPCGKWSTSQIRAATVGTLQVRIYTSVLYACNSKNGRTGYGTAGDRTGASLCFWGSASSVFESGRNLGSR